MNRVNKSGLGGAFVVLGGAFFAIPATISSSGVTIPLPRWLVLACMVSGLVVAAMGYFTTTVYLSATDDCQQEQIDRLDRKQTEFLEKNHVLELKVGPGTKLSERKEK